jgi:hypothetical protein
MNLYFSKIRTALMALLTLILLLPSSASLAELSAQVNRKVLASNETIQLTLRHDGQAFNSQPDFSPLQQDFEILSNNRQQQYSNVNGKSASYTDWNLTLRPKRIGIILIPSLTYKNDISNALEVTVRAAAPSGTTAAGTQPIYTETVVDKTEVYIQQQILLTQRLYTSVQLRDYSLSDLDIPGEIIQRLGDTQYQKVINGRPYLVLEVNYAIFPQSSGKLTIPALRFGAYESSSRTQFGGFSTRGNRILRDTQAKTISIMAKPAHVAVDQWMPSSGLILDEQWTADLSNLTVGEPITRTIRIIAKDLTGAQISPLNLTPSDAYRVYPDRPQIEEQVSDNGIVGTRTESLALVPNQAGEMTIPGIEVRWWDTIKQRMQTANLPAKRVQVSASNSINSLPQMTGSPLQVMQPIEPATEAQHLEDKRSSLLALSLVANILLLSGIAALIFIRRSRKRFIAERPGPVTSARLNLKQCMKAIEIEANKNNLMAVRDSIMTWGRCLFAETPPTTLKVLALLLDDGALKKQFDQLDRQLFKGEDADDALDITLLLKRLTEQSTFSRKSTPTRGEALKPLYPE